MWYEEKNWTKCEDMKVIGLFLGLQDVYVKYLCFLCLWDSRAKANIGNERQLDRTDLKL